MRINFGNKTINESRINELTINRYIHIELLQFYVLTIVSYPKSVICLKFLTQ